VRQRANQAISISAGKHPEDQAAYWLAQLHHSDYNAVSRENRWGIRLEPEFSTRCEAMAIQQKAIQMLTVALGRIAPARFPKSRFRKATFLNNYLNIAAAIRVHSRMNLL
jgi:hypothetical protein